jgi:hypothetical protein
MIKTIIKREFLDNLLSFKFIACVLVAIMVSLASTSILTHDYQDRLRNYDTGIASAKEALTKIPVYSSLVVKLFRKPTPMSIFVAGIERKAGSYAEIRILGTDIPTSLQGGGHEERIYGSTFYFRLLFGHHYHLHHSSDLALLRSHFRR